MQVKLVSHSVPTEEYRIQGIEDTQDLVAYTARVSNPGNQTNKQTADKLIKYLMKNDHWSPLEMASACLEITTTRDIARQILRHRSFSFQEFSQRYAEATTFITDRECRTQDTKNRQNSNTTDDRSLKEWWSMEQKRIAKDAEQSYRDALGRGIAKEQARALLPEGLTESTLYMSGTLRSWIHYCELRRGHGTQKEHMDVAERCWDIIGVHFPAVISALNA